MFQGRVSLLFSPFLPAFLCPYIPESDIRTHPLIINIDTYEGEKTAQECKKTNFYIASFFCIPYENQLALMLTKLIKLL